MAEVIAPAGPGRPTRADGDVPMAAALRDGTAFEPTRLGVEEGPFTQTITRRFRLTPKSAGRLARV